MARSSFPFQFSVGKAAEQSAIQKQAAANTLDQFLASPDLEDATIAALIESSGNFDEIKQDLLADKQTIEKFTRITGRLAYAIVRNPSIGSV